MLLQAISEPILIGAVVLSGGGTVIWFAKLGIDLKKAMEHLMLRVDDPQTGLLAMVLRNHKEQCGAMGALSNGHVDLDKRLTRVEDKMIHTA